MTINKYVVTLILLLPPLAVAVIVAVRSAANQRLVAVQFANAVTVIALALMSFAFDQSSSIDLALSGALLAVPGTYLFTVFMERWL